MRRARIKAVANVPLRRKATQDIQVSSPSQASSPKDNAEKVQPESSVQETLPASVTEETINFEKTEDAQPETTVEQPVEQITIAPDNPNEKYKEISRLPQIPIPQSPDNTFAVLGSPPYRSESLKSDNISIKSPGSPSKLLQNRSRFVRPVPRLDGSGRIRRNSIQGSGASASESEDDGRRSNVTVASRIRNDSVCSVQSSKEPTTNVGVSNPPESRPVPKRRMVISESARKLAEARREFLHKHGNKTPDRNKLTMYDLIYYNPVTNPMKAQDDSVPRSRQNSIGSVNGNLEQEEENVDEPTAMPVPQVKVGPDGQLIIDEQSLVIEQTGTKKGREALANSDVVIDEGRISNGFYKRPRKSKDWPKLETLRFYTALNTIGTDFLLMQSLFPNRSRQEIKLKFKKEEKLNRTLVEKALKYHQEFDTDALEEELAVFEEREKLELEEKKRAKENKTKEKERSKTKKKKRCAFATSSIEQGDETEDEPEEVDNLEAEVISKSEANNNCSIEKTRRRTKRKPTGSIEEALDDLMQGAGIFSESESDTEIYEIKPTRSGRCPKMRKLQAPDINKLDEVASDETSREELTCVKNTVEPGIGQSEKILEVSSEEIIELAKSPPETVQHTIPDMSKVEPGSLVILSSETPGEPGKTMLQVYMVSPNPMVPDPMDMNNKQNMAPVDLSSELLATVTTKVAKVDATNVDGLQSVNTT